MRTMSEITILTGHVADMSKMTRMALLGHAAAVARCPLLGIKQTCLQSASTSANDPQPSCAARRICDAAIALTVSAATSRRDTLRPVVLKLREDRMKRRELIAASAALLVSPRRSLAQGTRRRLGFLNTNEVEPTVQKAWLDGLRNHGWIDGRNLIIEYRYASSHDRLPAFAAELVALSPDLLIAPNPPAAAALKSATASIPILFVAVADPVGIGLVQSLSRPGGNITGLATLVPGFTSKMIEILWEMVPGASKIAILTNPGNPMHTLAIAEELPQTARKLGVALPVVEATTADKLDIAFASAAAQNAMP
jgi:ABC transporter substrate binding protein